jgi:hypothetical protein
MKEAHENALCPCESGKKYFDCCLPRHIEKSRQNPHQDWKEELKKEMAGKDISSLDEANRFLRAYYERRNSEPKPDFLGLSSDQVHRLIDLPFSHTSDMVLFTSDFGTEDMAGIPVVTQTERFLGDLSSVEPLKATVKGNLPPDFAKPLFIEFDETPLKSFIKFRTETDSMTVHSLRLILSIGGWIKKEKGYFRLTRKGTKAVDQGFSAADYLDLFTAFVQKFNWGYQDGYPPFEIIQRATLFSLFILHKKARDFRKSYSLSPYFIRAFPLILVEAEPRWDDVFSQIDRCYETRFLERFCAYFGLIELRERNPDPLDRTLILKTSPFFDRLLTWKI